MKKLRIALFASIASLILSAAPTAMAADAQANMVDPDIVSEARWLTIDEIRGADVTDGEEGRRLLAAAADGPDGLDVDRRAYRVFSFGRERIVIDASSRIAVRTGRNRDGEQVYEILPEARPNAFTPRAGYIVPPNSAWVFNRDGGFTHTTKGCDWFGNNCVDVWKRVVHWTITAAWNQSGYQYFRNYGRMQAQSVTGAYPDRTPWARAELELDNGGGWGGNPTDNFGEFPEPDEDIPGRINTTVTVGFKVGITVELGKPPVTVGGGVDETFTGSLTTASEWWHPIVRTEVASGGVQFCKYTGAVAMNKKVATRVSLRQTAGASLGFWYLHDRQSASTSTCPGQN